jgi:hypothetical protein
MWKKNNIDGWILDHHNTEWSKNGYSTNLFSAKLRLKVRIKADFPQKQNFVKYYLAGTNFTWEKILKLKIFNF